MTRFRHTPYIIALALTFLTALAVFTQSDSLKPDSGNLFVVNTTADTQDVNPGNGICADSNGMCSLRAAITEANAIGGPNEITLPAGTYTETLVAANENANAGGDFDITSSISITGAGAASTIVQAAASPGTATERVFHVLAGSASIDGVTIQNGVNLFSQAIGGGGVRVEGATTELVLSNSTVTHNQSESRGGGVHANKAQLTIANCNINNNSAGSAVAGTSGSGGGVAIDSEDNVAVAGQGATISNTVISNNTAQSSVNNTFGGGISIRALNANVFLNSCTINNNNSNATNVSFSGFAGGIFNQQANTTLTACTVSGNTSSRFHAGIRNLSLTVATATLSLIDTTVSGNTSSADDAQGGGLTNIVGSGFAATMNIDRSTISGNTLTGSTSVGGGIINVNGGTAGTAVSMNITNSTVSGNAAHDAAGIYSDGSGVATVINFSTIANNTADATMGAGGGIFQDTTPGGSTTISNSIAANNTAGASVDVNDLVTSGNYNHIKSPDAGFVPAANDVTGTDPLLGPLGNNGGPTQTHLPNDGSPVRNTIPNGANGCGTTVTNDQRGSGRPIIACEKGSVELPEEGTPTSTNTNTPTFTPTPAGSSISGTVTYGNATSPPVFISNVTVTGTGSPNVFTTTAAPGPNAGQYTLTGFGSGSYTVSLSKTTGANNITSFDAARIAQHVVGISPFTRAIQLVTADVTDNGTISSQDAAFIARYVVASGAFGLTGSWRFFVPPGPTFPAGSSPTTRTYASVTGNIAGEDYIGVLYGDVTGNWSNTGARAVGNQSAVGGPVLVDMPQISAEAGKDVTVPVNVYAIAGKGVIAYELDLRYDPKVLETGKTIAEFAKTISRGLYAVVNADAPGHIRVVVYGAYPIDEDGVLLNLHFHAVGSPGSTSPLTIERIMFNEGDPAANVTDGKLTTF